MFESLISGVLGRYLGDYIKNLDQTALNLSVWKGDLELRNLEFKENAFKEFKVPILVKQGCVGKLSLQIPWNNLTGEAIVVILEDVYVLVGPNSAVHYDEKAEKEHERQKKKAGLKLLEYQLSPTEKQQSDSLFSALVTTIVDNIQVQFKRIHIRYQPDVSLECNDPPFDSSPNVTIGITLDQFSIISTNSQFVPTFITELHKIIYKRGSVGNFGIYCNTKDKPIQFQSNEHLKQTLEELLKEKDTNYIVKPISMDIKMVFNKSYIPNKQIPWLTMDVLVNQLTFALNEVQYKSVLALVDYFLALNQKWQNRMYRPIESPVKNPRAWWKYAFRVVKQNFPSTKFRWVSQQLLARRGLRKEYVALYKLKLKGLLDVHNVMRTRQGSFIRSPDNNNNSDTLQLEEIQHKKARLQEIEDILRMEEIAYYRQLATDELISEGFDRRAIDAVKNAKKKQKQSWWSSWLYPGYYYYNSRLSIPAVVHSTLQSASPTQRTQEEFVDEAQKKFLKIFQMISDQGLFSGPPPSDFVQYKIMLKVEQGSIRLHAPDNRNIGAINFQNFMLGTKIYPKTISLGMSLQSFQVTDEITPKNNFPIVLSPFDMENKQIKLSNDNNNSTPISQFDITDSMDDNTDHLFDLLIEYCPYDLPGVDFHIKMVNQPVQIVYNKSFIERLIDFFTREEDEGYGRNFKATKSISLTNSGSFTVPVDKSKLEPTVTRDVHKTLKLNIKLRAPQILFPENVSNPQGCMVAVADLGKLSILSTDYFAPSDQPDTHHYSLYVRMAALNLNLTHVTCSSPKVIPRNPRISFRSSYKNLRHSTSNVALDSVIKNFDLNFTVSLIAKQEHLPHINVSGNLPALELSLSSSILSHLTRIAMAVIIDNPNTPSTQSPPSAPAPPVDSEKQKKIKLKKERLMKAIHFQGTFTLNQLRVVVLSNNSNPQNKLLISLVLRNISTSIVQRTFDTRVESSLFSLLLIDHLATAKFGQKSPESYLATTYNDIRLTEHDAYSTDTTTYDPSLTPFVQLSYVFISHDSPKYKDVDSLLQFKMENLNATLHRETAMELLQFVQTIDFTPRSATAPIKRSGSSSSNLRMPVRSNSGNILLLSTVRLAVGERRASISSPSSPGLTASVNLNSSFVTRNIDPNVVFQKKTIKFQLVASCRSLHVSLHENWIPLCSAGVDGFRFSLKQYNDATNTLKASIVNVTANQTPSPDAPTTPRPILYSRPEPGKQIPLFSISYKFDSKNSQKGNSLLVKVNRIGYFYNNKFLDEMQRYFEPFTSACIAPKAESKSLTSKEKTLKYKVLVTQPEITIPMDWDKSRMGSIKAEFKDIFIYNGTEVEKQEDEIEISYEKHSVLLNEMTVLAKLNADGYNQLTSNVNILVEIRNNPKLHLMAVDIPDLSFEVTLEEYHLIVDLYKMLFQNSSPSKPDDYKDDTKVLNRISVQFGKLCWNLVTDQPIQVAPEKQVTHHRNQSLTQSTDLRLLLDVSTGSEARYEKFHEVRLQLSGRDLVRSGIRDEINKGIGLSILSRKIDSLVVLYRLSGNLKVQLYRTEIQHDSANPAWKAFRIPIHNINHDETIILECYDFASVTMNDLIGTFETNLTGLLHQDEFELINPKLKKKQKGYLNSGVIQVISADLLTASGAAEIPAPPTMKLEDTRHSHRSRSRSLSLGLLKPDMFFGTPPSERNIPMTPRNPKVRTPFASLCFHETCIKYVKTHQLSMLVDWTAEVVKATNYHTHYDVKEFLNIKDFQLHYNYNLSEGRGHGLNLRADDINFTYVAHLYKHMKDFIFPGLYRFSQDENIERPLNNNNNDNNNSSSSKIPFQFRVSIQCEDLQIQMLVDPNNMNNVSPPAEANEAPVLTNTSCTPLLARCRFTAKYEMIESSTSYSMLLDNFHILKWSSVQEPVSYEMLFDSGPMIPAYDSNKPGSTGRSLNESAESSATEASEVPEAGTGEKQVVLYPITFQLKYWNNVPKKDCGLSATAAPAMQFVLSIQDYRVLLGFYYSLFDQLPFRLYPDITPATAAIESDYDMALHIQAQDLSMVLVHERNEMPPLLFFDLQTLLIQGSWPRDVTVSVDLSASNYNMYKAAWEPFIEKWPMKLGYKYRIETTPATCNLTEMSIEGIELLNINITDSFVYNAKAWMDDGSSTTGKNKNYKLFNALSIRNLNSRRIFFRLSNTKDKIEVQPQERKVISTITKSKKREADVLVDRKLSLYVELNYFKELPIIDEGITILPLSKSKLATAQYLVYEVQFENGRRLITLRSTILIHNKTQFPLEIYIRKLATQKKNPDSPTLSPLRASLKDDSLSSPEKENSYYLNPIPPGENGSVPLDYVNKGLLFFRPLVNGNIQANLSTSSQDIEFDWSDPLDCDLSHMKQPVYLSMPAKNIPYTFYCCIGVTADTRFSVPLYNIDVCTPLVFENLLCSSFQFKLLTVPLQNSPTPGTLSPIGSSGSVSDGSGLNSPNPTPPPTPPSNHNTTFHTVTPPGSQRPSLDQTARSFSLSSLSVLKRDHSRESLLQSITSFNRAGLKKSGRKGSHMPLLPTHTVQGNLHMADTLHIYNVSVERKQQVILQVKLEGYQWSEETEINSMHHGTLRLADKENRILTLHFEHNIVNGFTHQIIVYSKYWIYNCSEFAVSYYTAPNKDNPHLAAGQEPTQPRDLLSYDLSWFIQKPPVTPYLYSYPLIEKKFTSNLKPSSSTNLLEIDDDDSNQYTILQIEDSKLSKPISFAVVQEGEVKLKDKSNSRSFLLGVSVQVAPNPKFRRTKTITIVPRYLLVNKTRHKLYYQQVDFDKRFTLEINQVVPFHWPKKRGTKQLSFSVDLGNKWTWSGGLNLTEAGEFYLKLIKIHKNQEYFIKVDIKPDGKGAIRVTFLPKSKEIYPYRIVNLTNQPLCFWQAQNESVTHTVQPSESIHYAWDSYVKPRFIYLRLGSFEFKRKVSLDKFKSRTNGLFKAEVVPDGPTKVLKIEDMKMNQSGIISESEHRLNFSKRNIEEVEAKFIFHLELNGIGFSIISETPRPQELLYIHLEMLRISYENSFTSKSLMASVEYFQVDNQLYYTPYPVMLHPLAVSSRKQHNIHAFQMSLIQSNEYQTFRYYHYCSILFQEMYLAIDAALVDDLLRWIYKVMGVWFPEEDMEKKFLQGTANIPLDDTTEIGSPQEPRPQILSNFAKPAEEVITDLSTQSIVPANEALTKMVYFEMLHINPLKLNVSFYSDDTDLQMTDSPLRQLLGAAVGKIPNIENAPLKLNALLLEHPFATPEQLADRITKHYFVQAIKGSYKLLGSVEFLGNPVNIVSSFGTGFKDFFYEPISGIVHGEGEFGKAVSKGAKSLAKKSVYALFSGSSKITSEISNALTHVTMDREYQAKRKQQYLSRPQTVAEGFIEGAKDLSHGFFDGFAGVVTQPVKGAREEGAKGFFKGVGRGLLGMPIKPINGIIDFSTKVMQGVSSAVKDDQVARFRLPRHFAPNGLLVPYDAEHAYRKFAMALIKRGKYANDNCLFHLIILPNLYLVTDTKVLCVKESKHSHHFNLVWKVTYEEIALVFKSTSNHNVVLRKVKTTQLRSKAKDESNVQYIAPHHSIKEEVSIPTTEEATAEMLFNAIQQAWSAWHKENTQTLKKDTKVSLKNRISSFKVSLEKRKDRILAGSRKNSFGSDQEELQPERLMSIISPDSTSITSPESTNTDTEAEQTIPTKKNNNNNNNDDTYLIRQQSDIAPVTRSKRSESLFSRRSQSLVKPIINKLKNEQ